MSSGFGVFTLDTAQRVRSWNQWLAAATGVSEAAACRLTATDVVAPSRSALIGDVLAEVMGNGTTRVLAPAIHRYLVLCPPTVPSRDFTEMQQLVTVAPLRSDEGIVGAMVTIEDVTQRLEPQRQTASTADGAGGDPLSALGSADWRVRAAAAGNLRQSATREQVAELIASLRRDHHNFSVLNSALQVLMAVNRDVTGPLGELLGDPDPNVRMHAALALGNIGGGASVPALIAALDDPDQNVRFHAIEALGRMRAVAAVEPLVQIAKGGDFFLAFPAIDALAAIDDASVLPALVGLMDQELLRPAIVDALAEHGDEDCVVPLTSLLDGGGATPAVAAALVCIADRYQDTYGAGEHIADLVRLALTDGGLERVKADVRARREPRHGSVVVAAWAGAAALDALLSLLDEGEPPAAVVDALLRIGAPAVMPLVALLRDGGRDARIAAATVLGQIGDKRAVPALVGTLAGHDAELVAVAARTLGQLGDAEAVEPLLGLFAHQLATVRQAAIGALQSIGSTRTTSGVGARLRDSDPLVRECAVRVVGYFGFDDCGGTIAAALADPDEDVRRAAIEQVPLIDDPECAARLVGALVSEVPKNRAAAAHALRAVDAPVARRALIEALRDDEPWVRYFAASSLEQHGASDCADILCGIARSDPAPHVRIAATRAAGAVAPEAFAAHAPALAADGDDDIAAAAIAAMGRVEDPSAGILLEQALQGSRLALRLAAAEALGRRATPADVQMLAWAARLAEPAALAGVATEGLRRVAVNPDASGRAAAVTALVALAADPARRAPVQRLLASLPAELITVLEQELHSSRAELRAVIVEAIARMRHPDATGTLAQALGDEHPLVRGAAVAAFGRLGSPLAAAAIAAMAGADADPAVRRRAAAVCRRYGWNDGGRG